MTSAPIARALGAPGQGNLAHAHRFATLLDALRRTGRIPAAVPGPASESCWVPTPARCAAPQGGYAPRSTASRQLDRIAAIASVDRPRPRDVTLGVSSDVGVRLSRNDTGLCLVIEAAPQRASSALEQLPLVLRALRAHGVSVAHASVRTVLRRSGAR